MKGYLTTITLACFTLSLTSSGSFNSCPNTFDSLKINFTNAPIVILSPDVLICANNPTVALTGTDKENLPLAPVETPTLVPFTFTLTPGKGSPSSLEVTVPVIVLSCAIADVATNNKMNKLRRSFFIKLII